MGYWEDMKPATSWIFWLLSDAEFGTAPTVQLPALLLEARPVSGTLPASTVNKGNGIMAADQA
jgi:hypothetical protein